MAKDDVAPQRWMKKYFDADGYFELELVQSKELMEKLFYGDMFRKNPLGYTQMFLTADDASSLTLKGKCAVVIFL